MRFQENSEDVSRAGVLGGVGAEVPGAAPGVRKARQDAVRKDACRDVARAST